MPTATTRAQSNQSSGARTLVSKALRWPAAIGCATAVATALLWTMQYLISTADASIGEPHRLGELVFVRIKPPEVIEPVDREKPTPPTDVTPPPTGFKLDPDDVGGTTVTFQATPPKMEVAKPSGVNMGGLGDGRILPIVKVAPIYPTRAIERGIEGFCVVKYTVATNGAVRKPAIVEDQCTSSLFRRASISAALKFRYRPEVVDGVAIAVPNVRNKFVFALEN